MRSEVAPAGLDGEPKQSTTHEIDHVRKVGGHALELQEAARGRCGALEIEWNNKDPHPRGTCTAS